ncbi:MAG: hypothetical protein AAGL89_14235 [Pseudomonadota bacterium]
MKSDDESTEMDGIGSALAHMREAAEELFKVRKSHPETHSTLEKLRAAIEDLERQRR